MSPSEEVRILARALERRVDFVLEHDEMDACLGAIADNMTPDEMRNDQEMEPETIFAVGVLKAQLLQVVLQMRDERKGKR